MTTRCCTVLAGFITLAFLRAGAADATQEWAFFTQGVVSSSPALGDDGTIYVGSESKRLLAINPDGSLKWRFPDTLISTADWFDASPTIAGDGTVYAPNFDGSLYAVDAHGSLKWTYTIPSYFLSSPAIGADGMIYVGGGDGMLHAIRPDGSRAWTYATGDWVDSSPAIGSDGTVYFGSWDGRLYAIRPDGTLRWSFATGDAILSSPAIGPDGTIYIGSADTKLYAIRPDGTLRWSVATGDSVDASPVVGPDGTVYFGSADGKFRALAPDGSPAWAAPYDAGQGIFGGAVLRGDGALLLGGSDRALHALNPDGSLNWKYQTGDAVDSTAMLAADGTIFFGSYDGKLYALSGNGNATARSSWPRFRADVRLQGRVDLAQMLLPPTILQSPLAQSVGFGEAVTFSVQADGTQPFTYLWWKDGVPLPSATGSSLYIAAADGAAAGVYQVHVSNAAGTAVSPGATLTVAPPEPPQIVVQPRALVLASGSRLSLWVEATGSEPLVYQWSRDGVDLPGATTARFEIAAAAASDAGAYQVRISNAGGTIASVTASVSVGAVEKARLVNLSTRTRLQGDATLIPGFVVTGTGSRELLVRAIGPALEDAGVSSFHPDPRLRLIPPVGDGIYNDNWSDAPNAAELILVSESVGAYALPTGSLDAAALFRVMPGAYTLHVTGPSEADGVLLVELYDAGQADPGDARLVNISARGDTGEGEDVMIPGFVLAGPGARTLLIRAVGPSLSNYGVTDFLPDPVLSLFAGSARIMTGDNWGDAPDVEAIRTIAGSVGAFPLEENSADAVLLVVLMPGAYTAQAHGSGTTDGNVLVEVYEVP